MAGKRLRDEPEGRDAEESEGDKRMKTIPSLTTVIREVMGPKSFQTLATFLEPVLRRVVQEEVERGLVAQLTRSLQRSSRIEKAAVDVSTTLKFVFSNGVAETIFTGSKIEDKEGNPLRLLLVDTSGGSRSPVCLGSPVRVEIVVVDGDFPGEQEDWTSEEFDKRIVKEREGKRPLLTGNFLLTLRDGSCSVGELAFTDNSSWIRSRRFRLGARVAPGSCEGLSIKEAMTDPFMVKDHRGVLCKKHYPPALHDEVWRLYGIGKDGAFHKKLQGEHINTVQDFLKLLIVNPDRLRAVLGPVKSEKTWERTFSQAKSCTMGNKLYVHRRNGHVLLLNPICEVRGMLINGHACPPSNLNRADVHQLVLEAYRHWDQLEVIDETLDCAAWPQESLLVPQIAKSSSSCSLSIMSPPNHQEAPTSNYDQYGGFDVEDLPGDHVGVEFNGWILNQAFPDPANY